ncbi:hypothetical protein Sjap_007976 [Stephania japonica]|uniref:Uncharacterized protein n=1 Tax=Stephania japonica TaxID=461633 RepID=A0AAP0JNR1_9MAGN
MVKLYSSHISLLLLLMVLFSGGEREWMVRVDAKTCKIASLGCNLDAICNQQCLTRYNGQGSCYRPPGTFIVECMWRHHQLGIFDVHGGFASQSSKYLDTRRLSLRPFLLITSVLISLNRAIIFSLRSQNKQLYSAGYCRIVGDGADRVGTKARWLTSPSNLARHQSSQV